MLSRRLTYFFILFGLFGTMSATASDENPWRQDDDTTTQAQPFYDLNGGWINGPPQPRGNVRRLQRLRRAGNKNETIVPKTSQSRPGKGNREEYFGYAGPNQKLRRSELFGRDQRHNGRFSSRGRGMLSKEQLQHQEELRNRLLMQGGEAKAFANVPPPPVPETRLSPYPYMGYGMQPRPGGVPGVGMGYGYGSPLMNPMAPGMHMPGMLMPGFMW